MQAFAQSIVETVLHPQLVLDAEMRVVVANAAFYRAFGSRAADTVGHGLFELNGGQWAQIRLRALLVEGAVAPCPKFMRLFGVFAAYCIYDSQVGWIVARVAIVGMIA